MISTPQRPPSHLTQQLISDDGVLVRDINGNGLIDSGRELFGDETILANGQKAAHGFAALRELDTGGSATPGGALVGANDGIFDAKDAQYANLRIWRDLNQDGISQANELKTLLDTGVTSIKLGSSATNTNYGDAVLVQSSTFTRADQSTGQAGSFILAQNNFVRQFIPITVSAAASALPGIKGSGWVRDLQEVEDGTFSMWEYIFKSRKDNPICSKARAQKTSCRLKMKRYAKRIACKTLL